MLYVLEDTDGLGIAWCSHKSAKPPPPPATAAAMGALPPLLLRAGDLIVLAGTTLTAWQPGAEPAAILELILEHDSRAFDSMEAAMVADPAFYKIDGAFAAPICCALRWVASCSLVHRRRRGRRPATRQGQGDVEDRHRGDRPGVSDAGVVQRAVARAAGGVRGARGHGGGGV